MPKATKKKKAPKAPKKKKAPKAAKKKALKKEAVKKQAPKEESLGKEIGKVTHYFTNLSVAIIELKDTLKVGDKIRIKGATSDFKQKVESMQIEHEKVEEAKKGQGIGLKVKEHARENDTVYKI